MTFCHMFPYFILMLPIIKVSNHFGISDKWRKKNVLWCKLPAVILCDNTQNKEQHPPVPISSHNFPARNISNLPYTHVCFYTGIVRATCIVIISICTECFQECFQKCFQECFQANGKEEIWLYCLQFNYKCLKQQNNPTVPSKFYTHINPFEHIYSVKFLNSRSIDKT